MRTVIVFTACLIFNSSIASAQWYSGGNLHGDTIGAWKQASQQNRLATAADFVAKTYLPSSLDQLNTTTKRQAIALVRCIDEAGADAHSNNLQVAEIAAACLILMGGQ